MESLSETVHKLFGMTSIDPAVASVLDDRPANDDSDDDNLLESLENDPALDSFREQRIQQLHEELARAKHLRNQEHGHYTEMNDEKALMDIVSAGAMLSVVHFFRSDFHRCGIMDAHLDTLAPLHFDTRFLRINVDNAPFLVTKLKVQLLPCVIAFRQGVSIDRIIGFEGLGYSEETFSTKDLERRLVISGALVREKLMETHSRGKGPGLGEYGTRNEPSRVENSEDDWD
ncbi:MAG: hypothetical protein LQ348_001654 [Seirophora lacunosa]|nr:MAG: hypothetical protein LQ348_001654 [Seirophora lacunosa]